MCVCVCVCGGGGGGCTYVQMSVCEYYEKIGPSLRGGLSPSCFVCIVLKEKDIDSITFFPLVLFRISVKKRLSPCTSSHEKKILKKKKKFQTFCKKNWLFSTDFFFFSIQKITHIAMAKSVTHRRTKAIFLNLPPSEYSRSMSGTHRNPNKQQPICKLHKSRINTSLSFFMIAVN